MWLWLYMVLCDGDLHVMYNDDLSCWKITKSTINTISMKKVSVIMRVLFKCKRKLVGCVWQLLASAVCQIWNTRSNLLIINQVFEKLYDYCNMLQHLCDKNVHYYVSVWFILSSIAEMNFNKCIFSKQRSNLQSLWGKT